MRKMNLMCLKIQDRAALPESVAGVCQCSGTLLRPTKNSILVGPFACSHCLNTKSTQLHLAHRHRCTQPALFASDPALY